MKNILHFSRFASKKNLLQVFALLRKCMNPCLPAFVPLAGRPPGRLYEDFALMGFEFLQFSNPVCCQASSTRF